MIRTKRGIFNLYEKGRFGNKLRTWSSELELLRSGYDGEVSLRYEGSFCQWFESHVPIVKVGAVVEQWVSEGARLHLIRINESAPDHELLIQGELLEYQWNTFLTYSTEKGLDMRQAMENPKHMKGWLIKEILRVHMTPESFGDMEELLAEYPEHVIEFSTYQNCLGDCPGRNSIFWEVRGEY